ncbi:hypothetical protein [Lichenicoccus sp.]|uniref:hypothetical protein n=1 Tax=Lichenicoccus sp. TaxID=2781899 RepID=UPI003D0E99EA
MTHPLANRDPEDAARLALAVAFPALLDLQDPHDPQDRPAAPPMVDALLEVMEARWHDSPADRWRHDGLAWELLSALPLPPAAHVVEADRRGTRWTRRWIERGHRVTTLAGIGDAAAVAGDADLVLATASLQAAHDPHRALQHLSGLLRPGGVLCVRVETLLSLVLGWRPDDRRVRSGERRLYDSATLKAALLDAGLVDARCHALAVTATASGRLAACAPPAGDAVLHAAIDRHAAHDPLLADAGLHILAVARRP